MPRLFPYIIKNAILGVPGVKALYRRRQLRAGYDAGKNDPAYPLGVFRKHAALVQPIAGADVLEIGPGGNLGVALGFLLSGARSVTAIDLVPYVQGDLGQLYENIAGALGHAGDGARAREIQYLAPVDMESCGLPDASFDIIYSHACFEHFLHPDRVIAEIRRLLRPGGRTSHQIDLADHRDKTAPLDFLRFSDTAWRLACSSAGNWATNRWRASEFRHAFSDGFAVTAETTTDRYKPEPSERASFARRFADLSSEDLEVIGYLIAARRA